MKIGKRLRTKPNLKGKPHDRVRSRKPPRRRQSGHPRQGDGSARRLWAEPGSYEAGDIRSIAAEAGYSTGAVFANFDSKADLWREVMGYEPPVDCIAVRRALSGRDEVKQLSRAA